MSRALDMSLDDIIKNNKKSAAGSRGRGRGSAAGPARRVLNRSANRSAPYSVGKVCASGSPTPPIFDAGRLDRMAATGSWVSHSVSDPRLRTQRGSTTCTRLRWVACLLQRLGRPP
ncbi:hypothetical protein B296_00052954 [Ensete ventricosum]|uniref:Uncharacterized protein n=1 Tax=Ensete ventricosum TaxID=4639 RepID=A0A426X7W2_ENSVE|nr:hypothetical protein B296_00052954 [Ensete ventricosum]